MRIDRRTLNRALLDRQLLLRRSALPVLDAVRHLVGLQAQAPNPPYFGLWARLDGFRPDVLSELIIDRMAVRVAVMRGTVHLVTAEDCLALRPLVQPAFDRPLKSTAPQAVAVRGLALPDVVRATRTLLAERPRTTTELGVLLQRRWPDRDPAALVWAMRLQVALIQVPPRGIWGSSGQPTVTTPEAWLGRGLDRRPAPQDLVLRYLAAFGPASVRDAQTWSGLTRLGEVFERLRPRLRTYRDQAGAELFDLPDAVLPDPGTRAPVRYLPEYDNCLRSHADRDRVVSEPDRQRLASKNDAPMPTFLVDGFVRGKWRLTRSRGAATLTLQPFARLSKKDTSAVTAEAGRLLDFAAPGVAGDIRFDDPD